MGYKGKVLAAMSGGIDSTVTAVMLKKQGYDVIGITMKIWDYQSSGGNKKETGCCSLDSINDARAIAVENGIPHYILDLRKEFGDAVIHDFINEYLSGRTPNPCVLCNTFIKWDALLSRADQLECDYIATGHYANIRNLNGRYIISRGRDSHKDQSYVLWGLSQENLARTILPLGNYKKTEIREIAKDWGYDALVSKSESYEICFIPDNDYRGFLKRKVRGLGSKVKQGDYVLTDGTKIGKHKGYPFYTVGQRKGLGIALSKPMYVVEIRPENNTVVLGTEEELKRKGMIVKKVNWGKYPALKKPAEGITAIRANDTGAVSTIRQTGPNEAEVIFHHGVKAIAPGQSAVFYEGSDILGGGRIYRSFDPDNKQTKAAEIHPADAR